MGPFHILSKNAYLDLIKIIVFTFLLNVDRYLAKSRHFDVKQVNRHSQYLRTGHGLIYLQFSHSRIFIKHGLTGAPKHKSTHFLYKSDFNCM